MNCLNCQEEFDSVNHVPRLLPHCGHTLCSMCINRLISSNFIICTQCQELNMAFKESDLPKNLAILRIKSESKRTIASDQMSEHSAKQSASHSSSSEEKCPKHSKKLQAFCLQCFQYMCLQCVITHPKEHQLKTLQEAVGYFKDQTKKIIKFYRQMKLNYKMQRIELEKADVLSTVNQHKARISKLFADLKTYLEQKQSEAINNLRGIHDAEVTRISLEEKQLETLLSCYNKLVELSHANTLRNCIENFSENRNLFNFNRQKVFYQGLLKREKMSAVSANKSDLAHWDQTFNKFKDKIAKDIRSMLEIRAELKQKPIISKNLPSSSTNHLQKNKKQPVGKVSSRPERKQNKQLHISLKELDKFSSPPQPKTHATATSRLLQCKTPIIVYGGYSEDEQSPGVEVYGEAPSKMCKFASGSGHVKFGIINMGNKIYIFGGKKDNKRISDIYVMDSLKQDIKQFGHLSKAKSGFGYCKRGNSCFVVGGNDGTILNDFQQYDFATHQLKQNLPKLTISRDELTAVLHKNEIYAIGGYNLDNELSLNVVEKYNFQTKKWTISVPLTIQRRSHSSISLDSGLYVAGGYDGKSYLSTIQRFNQAQNRWQLVCQMMQQRCTFGISQNPKAEGFFVFGGFAHQPLSTCQFFSAETKKCTPIQPLKSKRFMLAAVQVSWDV